MAIPLVAVVGLELAEFLKAAFGPITHGGRFNSLDFLHVFDQRVDGRFYAITGLGYTPKKTMSPTSGTMTSFSCQLRSGIDRLASSGVPWNTRW